MFKKLKKVPILATVLLLVASLVCAWPVGYSSVGAIYTTDGAGSCVKTTEGIFTARHIINGTEELHNFRVVKVWKHTDLMKIELLDDQNLDTAEIAKFIDPDKPIDCVGWIASGRQKVAIRGYIIGKMSKRFALTLSRDGRLQLEGAIMTTAHLIPGTSGGGCFQDGKLIGVNSMSYIIGRDSHLSEGQVFSIMIPMPGVKWLEK